jgi:hypothetical protein
MATFLFRAALFLLFQGSIAASPSAPDTLVALRARAQDSLDGPAQLALGRAYLEWLEHYHTRPVHTDTVWERHTLDSVDDVLAHAVDALGAPGSTAEGDSARVLRVRGWTDRTISAWETGGLGTAVGPLPDDLRLSPVLEELGENLLRACPAHGVLLTAGDADSYAAWYMRYVRGLGTDRIVVPYAAWRDDPALRARLAHDLKLRPSDGAGEGWLGALVQSRTVCVSMGFTHPPDPPHKHIKWRVQPLVWLGGENRKTDPVPPRDFVFAAAQLSLHDHNPWGEAVLALYGHAARTAPALCEPLATFAIPQDRTGCKR